MRLIHKLLFTLAALSFAAAATGAPATPQNGVHYLTLPNAQNTDAGNKVEVIEFFTYSCPHCFAFDPLLAEWVKKNADKIVFKRVHVGYNPSDAALQRLYATTEAKGVTAQTHGKAFAAIHEEHQRIYSDDAIFDWAAKNGIGRDKFIAAYRSFGIQARLNRSQSLAEAYGIDHWPMVAIGGRYTTSPSFASKALQPPPAEPEQQRIALQVMDHLLVKASAEKK
ncbi:MAG: thiol:disulfide interchange protein DsbA/DsbL [Massilia sp.]|nr:thiol:disulfide interchange protein DsbA/DsbL [Massilia sp.]